MNRVFISIGSNLGIRLPNILNAIKTIDDDSNIFIISKSPVYESAPMYNINQNKFLNIVLELKTNINPIELLYLFKGIEEHMGRKLNNKKNQPRIIDIDILDYNKIIYNDNRLILPHPRISERLFVLKPWSDICPEFKLPNMKNNIIEILSEMDSNNQHIKLYSD